jgi:hypothetical protein
VRPDGIEATIAPGGPIAMRDVITDAFTILLAASPFLAMVADVYLG